MSINYIETLKIIIFEIPKDIFRINKNYSRPEKSLNTMRPTNTIKVFSYRL